MLAVPIAPVTDGVDHEEPTFVAIVDQRLEAERSRSLEHDHRVDPGQFDALGDQRPLALTLTASPPPVPCRYVSTTPIPRSSSAGRTMSTASSSPV